MDCTSQDWACNSDWVYYSPQTSLKNKQPMRKEECMQGPVGFGTRPNTSIRADVVVSTGCGVGRTTCHSHSS